MPTPIREAALAAIAARLAAQNPTATVERTRRADVDADKDRFPHLNLIGGDWAADVTAEPGMTHYTMGFTVTGHVRARTDLLAEQALSALHADTVEALATWQPTVDGMDTPIEEGAEIRLLTAEESEKPVGRFDARFSVLLIAATGTLTTD